MEHPKIDVNKPDRDGRTGLYWAAYRCREKIVANMLEDMRVDVNQRNGRNESPLWKALTLGERSQKLIRIMIASGRDFDITEKSIGEDNSGLDVIGVAKNFQPQAIVDLLELYAKNPHSARFQARKDLGLSGFYLPRLLLLLLFFSSSFFSSFLQKFPN